MRCSPPDIPWAVFPLLFLSPTRGGSSLIQGSDAHAYLESWKKFDAICRDYHVDGEISAHTSYDMGIQRLQLVRQIVDGVPNPFVLGEEGYHYYHRRFYQMAEQVLRTEK